MYRESLSLPRAINKLRKEVPKAIVEGSNHPGACRCDICLQWWILMGPEEDEGGNPVYGPFTEAEIEAGKQIYAQE